MDPTNPRPALPFRHPRRGFLTYWDSHPGVKSGAELTLGERAADKMRNTMGSWGFVFGFIAVMILWAVANSVFYLAGSHGKHGFDPYPYILLNLFLSMLAAIQAPIIMMSQNRQDAKDRTRSELDFSVNRKAELEIIQLAAKLNRIEDKLDDLKDGLVRR